MLSKKMVKDIQSLGLKKHREETGMFVAEGPKVVGELLQVIPGFVETVYATEDWIQNTAPAGSVPVVPVSEAELERISQLQTPNKVVAVFRQLPAKRPIGESFTLYLDTLQDPGNFGTIIRIADWFGVKDIVCSRGCADLYNPKVIQSTMASIARVNTWHEEGEDWLEQQKAPVYAATLGGKPLSQFGKVAKGILLIGNESRGLSPELIKRATEQVTIPRIGEAESLNAAVATGIILSHLLA
jgi:RNA methyltransferase, TrmH family